MAAFEPKFRAAMQSRVRLLDQIMGYIVRRKGKQMRPMFVFLCARLCHGAAGSLPEATYRGAALIELLHTATLVHDDVVDEANYRRGFFSINALWKNKIAVLVGDYLLSKGLLLSIDHGDFELLRLVSTAVREMSEGELLQLEKARSLDITEEVYFEVIRQKTASLIAACCAVGAASSGADPATIARVHRFGVLTGLAFQLKDDLFDYGPLADAGVIGKPVGIDIKEKKLTLPLIHALSQAPWLERRRILYTLKNNTGQRKEIEAVMAFVQAHGGLAYATARMRALSEEAHAALAEFPDSPARQALAGLLRYTIEREK
ncbi:MAG: polyprenyl synthetase family protein [Hymenobacteraceae bacterium]|nr:polyprenyl synthetase family protein [Hymenobacteraceae bacterium]